MLVKGAMGCLLAKPYKYTSSYDIFNKSLLWMVKQLNYRIVQFINGENIDGLVLLGYLTNGI